MTDEDPQDEAEVAALLKLRERVEDEIADRESLADDPYPFADSNDKSLKCFILDKLGDGEIDGRILVGNMDMIYRWIQAGEVPTPEKARKHLKPVQSE